MLPLFKLLGSSGWTFVVVMVTLGSRSMIHIPFFGSESEFELAFDPRDFVSTNNDCLERHSLVLCHEILWNSHHFPVSFFNFPLLFFVGGLG
jgi:hypothetical protein